MIAVFAGNMKQFDDFKNRLFYGEEKLRYIASRRDIIGCTFTSIILHGTYYDNDDFDELFSICKGRVI